MWLRRTAFAALLLSGLAADAVAGEADVRQADDTNEMAVEATPLPLRWMPNWLMTSITKAIADATDPSDRSAKGK